MRLKQSNRNQDFVIHRLSRTNGQRNKKHFQRQLGEIRLRSGLIRRQGSGLIGKLKIAVIVKQFDSTIVKWKSSFVSSTESQNTFVLCANFETGAFDLFRSSGQV